MYNFKILRSTGYSLAYTLCCCDTCANSSTEGVHGTPLLQVSCFLDGAQCDLK